MNENEYVFIYDEDDYYLAGEVINYFGHAAPGVGV